jgi:hypothetical protein
LDEARDLQNWLQGHGIDANDSINGVRLPNGIHRGPTVHGDNYGYINELEERLLPLNDEASLRAELRNIAWELLNNTFRIG